MTSPGSPRVTVIVLTHDRPAELARTLAHCLADVPPPPVVVVDNASAEPAADRVRDRFPGVRVLRAERNLGAAGRNLGVRAAETPYVALTDDDTWWAPGSLQLAADLLDAHPRLAAVTARVLIGPEAREDPTSARMAASPLGASGTLPGTAILGFLAGASVVRRSAFLAAGGFHPRLFLGGEELLLSLDLAAAGWAMAYVPDLVVHHHPSPHRDAPGRRRLLVRNVLWTALLRRPLGSLPGLLARVAAEARRHPASALGVMDALLGVGWVLRSRRVVPLDVEAALRLVE